MVKQKNKERTKREEEMMKNDEFENKKKIEES